MGLRKAVIPAAGLGTRLYPATKSQPKEMLPLGTKPTIHLVAEELIGAAIGDILIVIGRHKRAIADHFDPGDGITPDDSCEPCAALFDSSLIRFFYTRQSAPRGLGDAVAHSQGFVGGDDFLVALGDSVITGPEHSSLLKRLCEVHETRGAAATVAVQRVPREATGKYGIVAFDGLCSDLAIELTDIIEKPGPDRAPSDLAVCARYAFSPLVFEYLAKTPPGRGGEVQLTDAIQGMIKDGHPVYAVPLQPGENRLDVGNFESYAQAFIRLMLEHENLGPRLREYTSDLLAELTGDAPGDEKDI